MISVDDDATTLSSMIPTLWGSGEYIVRLQHKKRAIERRPSFTVTLPPAPAAKERKTRRKLFQEDVAEEGMPSGSVQSRDGLIKVRIGCR